MTDKKDLFNSKRLKRAEVKPVSRLIVDIWGLEKTGKTSLALSFPEPVVYLDFDLRSEGALRRLKNRDIYRASYFPPDALPSEQDSKKMLANFLEDYDEALKMKTGTIVIDTGTQLNQIVQAVEIAKIKAKRKNETVYPFDYATANTMFQNTINRVKRTKLNLVIVHRARKVYNSQGNWSGKWEAQENGAIPYLVQATIRMDKIDGKFVGTVELCGLDPSVEKTTVPDMKHQDLTELLY